MAIDKLSAYCISQFCAIQRSQRTETKLQYLTNVEDDGGHMRNH